jgi:hypothetical protein
LKVLVSLVTNALSAIISIGEEQKKEILVVILRKIIINNMLDVWDNIHL